MSYPGRLDGPDDRADRPALKEALRLRKIGRLGAPTEADVPPPSTFPMTKAARAALIASADAIAERRAEAKRRQA